jgi:hypothetical protein
MFAREELFHMDRRAIDYTQVVNGEMADAFINLVYNGLPYFVGAITLGASIYGASIYGIYIIYGVIEFLREISWVWYLCRPTQAFTFPSFLDMVLTISSLITITFISYLAYAMIRNLDTCLERAKHKRLELLAKIEALEKENESMRMAFKQIVAISQDDVNKFNL